MTAVKALSVNASAAAVTMEIEVAGERLFISFHGPAVVANGWQPYDQPNPSAYVPKSRDELHAVHGAGGTLLVSKETQLVRGWDDSPGPIQGPFEQQR